MSRSPPPNTPRTSGRIRPTPPKNPPMPGHTWQSGFWRNCRYFGLTRANLGGPMLQAAANLADIAAPSCQAKARVAATESGPILADVGQSLRRLFMDLVLQ